MEYISGNCGPIISHTLSSLPPYHKTYIWSYGLHGSAEDDNGLGTGGIGYMIPVSMGGVGED